MPKNPRPIILLLWADTHPNSMAGLIHPDGHTYDNGADYKPGRLQRWLWKRWEKDFIGFAADLKKRHRADLWAIQVGDGCDDNDHDKYDLIAKKKSEIVDIAENTWEPVRKIADLLFVFRGTRAHVGGMGELEDLVAKRIDAVPTLSGNQSWWSGRIRAHDVIADITHHAFSYSRRYWTIPGGAARQTATLMLDCQKRGWPLPRYAIRAHGHHVEDTGTTFPIRTFYLPPLQLTTPFGRRLGYSGLLEEVGGALIVCHPDGESDFIKQTYVAKGEPIWSLDLLKALKKN